MTATAATPAPPEAATAAAAPALGRLATLAWPDAQWPQALSTLAARLGRPAQDAADPGPLRGPDASASTRVPPDTDDPGRPSAEQLAWWAARSGLEALAAVRARGGTGSGDPC